jgi:hypothetical protein
MTNTGLITRVQQLAGEGYEDWEANTRSAIRESIIALVKSRNFNISDYPGLVVEKDVTIAVAYNTIAVIPLSLIIPSGYELIEWLWILKDAATPANDAEVSIISYPEYQSYVWNTKLLRTGQAYAYATYTTEPKLTFSAAFATNDVLKVKAVMWYDTLLTASALELSVYFSNAFLDAVIAMAVQRLKAEVNA